MTFQTSSTARPPAPAKVKILDVANELFYSEGIHTIGVDRIIAAARVTKATFYKHYRSKDLLIVAYVNAQHERYVQLYDRLRTELGEPAAMLRALVAWVGEQALRPGFHGCPFINAAAQFGDPEHAVRQAVSQHRLWERETLRLILVDLGHPRPQDGVDDLMLFRDGALSGSNLDDPRAAHAAFSRAVERIIAEREVQLLSA